ncbi:MAG: hypothetical protein WC881_11220, partial [Elusimicrobiota bacterium]
MQSKKNKPKSNPAPAVPQTPVGDITLEQQIIGAVFLGKVANYYSHLQVAAIPLEKPLAVGDTIRIKGHTTDLTQKVERMQVDRLPVQSASPGETAAIEIADKVRLGDAVYK